MPFRITLSGTTYETDTIDELVRLRAAIGALPTTLDSPETKPSKASPTEADIYEKWDRFTEKLSPEWSREAQRVLTAVKNAGGKVVTRERICELFDYKSANVVGGIVAGVVKNAQKADLDATKILMRDARGLRAGPLLLRFDLPLEWAATSTGASPSSEPAPSS